MDDLGEPSSYLAVSKGVPVYSSDGEKLGRVVRVMSAPNLDMFDGIVFDTTARPRRPPLRRRARGRRRSTSAGSC